MGTYISLPPDADFTYNPSSPTIEDIIQFTDTSIDSDGTIISWIWKFGDGDTSNLQNPTHDYTDDEIYTVILTVTDNDGATDSVSKYIDMSNEEPIARFTYNPSSPTNLDIIQFTDISTDPDGIIDSWIWNFGNETSSTTKNPTHRFSTKGTYTITLEVTDDDNTKKSISKTI